MLILLDETVQQFRIAPAKTASNCAGLGLHALGEVICCGVHAIGYTGEDLRKMQGLEDSNAQRLGYWYAGRYAIRKIFRWEPAARAPPALLPSHEELDHWSLGARGFL